MELPRLIGMVLYTYSKIEEQTDALWDWISQVEQWANQPFSQFSFSPRTKWSRRVWKATPQNRATLYHRLHNEQPWSNLAWGWPDGSLTNKPWKTHGYSVSIGSRSQPYTGMENAQKPSYLCLEVVPDVLTQSTTGIRGLLELGKQVWAMLNTVYGFIDVETGFPLQDNFQRNAIHLYDSTIPLSYRPEFMSWQRIDSNLNNRIWKIFWGNFLSAEHLRQLGGIQEMRRQDSLSRLLPEYLERAYSQGYDLLSSHLCSESLESLANDGVLLTLSPTPINGSDQKVQACREQIQETFGQIAIGPWDYHHAWFKEGQA